MGKELPMNEVFVYSKATKFCLDMFPPTNKQIRDRNEKHEDYFGDTNDIEAEAMSAMYNVFKGMSLYINLFDAYDSFKQLYTGFDDDDYGENDDRMDIDTNQDKIKKSKKKKKKKGKKKKNSKQEMSTDDENENSSNVQKISKREKMNQIRFRMSIDDLRFCGFVKATSRKEETLMKTADLL